jgi:hypothetical protein
MTEQLVNSSPFHLHPHSSSWNSEKNGGGIPSTLNCNNQSKKYWFTCNDCGHDFDTIIYSIFKGSWCRFCANKDLCSSLDCQECYQKSFASHSKSSCWSSKNGDLVPRKIYKNYSKKVWFKCDQCNIEFESKPNNVFNGKWCRKCGHKSSGEKQRMSISTFIERATNIHGNKYNYSTVVLSGVDTEVNIICDIHGQFNQTPYNHLTSYGCNKCARIIAAEKRKLSFAEFITRANIIHENKYDYSKVQYKSYLTPIVIVCSTHGYYEQLPAVHLRGNGCKSCGIESMIKKQSLTTDEFINRAKLVHGDKYNYESTIYINSKTNVNIVCKDHGKFTQNPYNHLKGCGCRQCITNTHSKQCIEWIQFMEIYLNKYIQHVLNDGEFIITGTKYKADGYIKDTNTILEFNGDYWHGNPNVYDNCASFPHNPKLTFGHMYQKTVDKTKQLKELGYNVIELWESDWIKAKKAVIKIQRHYRAAKLPPALAAPVAAI